MRLMAGGTPPTARTPPRDRSTGGPVGSAASPISAEAMTIAWEHADAIADMITRRRLRSGLASPSCRSRLKH